MSGQAIVTIKNKQWNVDLATSYWELTEGLGGLPSMAAGSGMFFDLGLTQTIQVTTVPMLFPLDIAFLSDTMVITEIYRNIQPGYLVTSTLPARYFLEVNAGELEGIDSGDRANVEVTAPSGVMAAPDWTTGVITFMGFMVMGILMVSIAKDLVKGMLEEPEKKPELLPQTNPRGPTGTCYADAWRFLIKEGEGELVHGTVFSGGRRLGHAWVETSSGYVWEPETRKYFTLLSFRDAFAPVVESRYTAEEAAIMAARTKNFGPWTEEERQMYLKGKSPSVITKYKQEPRNQGKLEFLADSPEYLTQTIDAIGYRDRIDDAFQKAIRRAKES
jgi:uncharacterized membrane protein (UPF0127 family)